MVLGISSIAISCRFNLTGWLVPQLTNGLIEEYRMSPGSAGMIASAETLTGGLLSMILSARATRWNLRVTVVVALVFWFAGNGLTLLGPNSAVFVALRLASGVGVGLMVFISSMLAAATINPDRTFGRTTLAANLFAAAVIASLPRFAPTVSSLAYSPYGALAALLVLPRCVRWLPGSSSSGPACERSPRRHSSRAVPRSFA